MIQSLQLILAFFWTRKQTVSLSLLHQELMGHCFRLIHFLIHTTTTEKHAEPFRSEQVLFQALHHASLVIFTSGFKGEKSTGLSSREMSSTATKSTLCFFPHLRQLRLRTCFSLYGQAPSFLVCFTVFPVTLRTPGSHSNIRSQIRPFKFTAHMLQLTLLRDPNTTTPKKTCLHFTFHLHFSFSATKHFNSHSYQGKV